MGVDLAGVLLVISSTVQLIAAWRALVLLRSARWHRAWALLLVPVVVIAGGRLAAEAMGGPTASLLRGGVIGEALILIASIVLSIGVDVLARAFRLARSDAENVRRVSRELAAREAQERYLVNHVPEAVAVLVAGRVAFANKVFNTLFEVNTAQVLGRPIEDFVLGENRSRLRTWLRTVLSHGTGIFGRSEWQVPGIDGLRWVALQAQRGKWDDEDAVFIAAFDVTAQRAAQDELRRHREHLEELVRERTALLRASEESFRALAENGQDVVMRFDAECRHLYASPIVELQTGIPASEFIGKTHEELGFPEDLVSLWEAAIRQVFSTRQANRAEFRLPSGIWIDWLLVPEFGDNGDVTSVIAAARDITDRKGVEDELRRHRAHLEELVTARTAEVNRTNGTLQREVVERRRVEEALRESEARLRSLYDNVSIGLYRTTPDGRVILANPALVRMLGYASFDELAARDLESAAFYATLSRSAFKELAEREGGVIGLETALVRSDGQVIVVRENARAIRDASGAVQYYEGTIEDITDQRRIEEHLRQAQRLEALGQLAGGIAHDFNNIMMAILGAGDLIERHEDDPAAIRRELEVVRNAVRRGSDLTRGLLTFARRQALDPVAVDLNAAISELLPMLRRVIPESVEIRFAPGDEPVTIRADRGSFAQLLLNLCVNARDAMPNGGTISIATEVREGAASAAVDAPAPVGRVAALVVADTGTGMDPATLAHIFEPFFTTKKPGEGSGMGLATVYGIVHQHGGSVSAASEPGGGTTFTVLLPTVEGVQAPAPVEEAVALGGIGETILVVEDEDDVREVLAEALRSLGYRVLAAPDGVAGLEKFREAGPSAICLVVSDVVMPRMGGNDLARAIRELAPEMPILFSSGYMPETVRHGVGLEGGGVAFIAKPYSIESLARKVRDLLDAGQRSAGDGGRPNPADSQDAR